VKAYVVSSRTSLALHVHLPWPFTRMSLIVGSASSGSIGPRPKTSCSTSSADLLFLAGGQQGGLFLHHGQHGGAHLARMRSSSMPPERPG